MARRVKILCCGDREWTDYSLPRRELMLFAAGTIVVHGDARGADRICGQIANALGLAVIPVAANWDRYGKAAGPVRNRAMLRLHPDIALVLAFHDHMETSKGTADMIACALNAGILVRLVTVHHGTTIVLPPQPKLI